MLTPEQVAQRLGISRSLVYRMCSSGRLVGYRLSSEGRGPIRIEDASVERLLAESRMARPEPAAKPSVHRDRPTLRLFAPKRGGA